MADLDDFFAKKDRKKAKGRKFTTTEEVAKKLEDTSKKTEKPPKKDRIQEGEEAGANPGDQDEWREFEEEKKDYSGLKIGNLTITSQEGASGNSESSSEQRHGEEGGGEIDRKTGPWKQITQQPVTEKQEEKNPDPVVIQQQQQPTTTPGTYVPPSLRNQQPQQPLQPARLRNKTAPDIHNEDFFPSLSSTKSDRKSRNEGSFEVVSHNKSSSVRYAEQTKLSNSQGPKLNLGNRYNTLSNDS